MGLSKGLALSAIVAARVTDPAEEGGLPPRRLSPDGRSCATPANVRITSTTKDLIRSRSCYNFGRFLLCFKHSVSRTTLGNPGRTRPTPVAEECI
jgi:hypothetical protein